MKINYMENLPLCLLLLPVELQRKISEYMPPLFTKKSPSCEAINKCIGNKLSYGIGRQTLIIDEQYYYICDNAEEVLERYKENFLGARREWEQEKAFNTWDDDDPAIDTVEIFGGFHFTTTYPYKKLWKPLYRVDGRRVSYEGERLFYHLAAVARGYMPYEEINHKYLGKETFTRLRSGKFYMRIEDEESDEESI